MAGRSRSLGTSHSPIAVERKRQRIDLAFQSMKDFAKLVDPGKRDLGQRRDLAGAIVDPDHEVLFQLAQRRDDLPVVLDLGKTRMCRRYSS
jgi:hypothetical protein